MVLCAVAQICSRSSIEVNAAICCSVIARASRAGAKLVCLPEASDFITSNSPSLSKPIEQSSFVAAVLKQARESNVHISVGVHESIPEESSRCYNTQLLVSQTGEVISKYRKLHMFDVDVGGSTGITIQESKTTKPGGCVEEPRSTPVGKVGMLTCYDLRFPEAAQALRRKGAEVITYPSAFSVRTGSAHWEPLLRARAIETQCYVLAAAQIGAHKPTSRTSYGHAMIVDPWGTIVAACSDFAAVEESEDPDSGTFCLADIDLAWLEKIRRDMPLEQQRRYDVFHNDYAQ